MFDFSVIIATYNRGKYLRECLNSLVAQTHKNFETIIVDDGSTDNTADVITEFINLIDIKYLKIPNSGFPGKPRNVAARLAAAEWLCFLDSDDIWTKNKLKTCLQFLNDNDIVYHKLKYFGEGRPFYRITIPSKQLKAPAFRDLMIRGNNIPLSGSLIRKSIFFKVGGFFEENASIGGLDDFDLWLKTSLITERFKFINKTLGKYRIHASNMTENSFSQLNKINIVFEKYLPKLKVEYHKQAYIIKNYYCAIVYERMKNFKEAVRLYKTSFESNSLRQRIKCFLRIILIKFKILKILLKKSF